MAVPAFEVPHANIAQTARQATSPVNTLNFCSLCRYSFKIPPNRIIVGTESMQNAAASPIPLQSIGIGDNAKYIILIIVQNATPPHV